ncbi:hypothetical protein IFM89_005673 [Coptis chinensis]|uniref:DNA-directed DNA polymerase family A palm domain-containing protein n=1 Tax=Coptis chinensis TaxID=261450 RepID=A0A835LA61_9MAGN|nr:hypothetical protein IFM89_005673 [Coptis chinensis]
MAMGFSTTQSGPFNPSCHTNFWVSSPSCYLLGTKMKKMVSSSCTTSYASFSPKIFPRRELHFLRCTNGPHSSPTNFCVSSQFLRNSSYSIRTYFTEDVIPINNTRVLWKLEVSTRKSSPCSSLARMTPYVSTPTSSEADVLSVPSHFPSCIEDKESYRESNDCKTWDEATRELREIKQEILRGKKNSVYDSQNIILESKKNESRATQIKNEYAKQGFSDSSSELEKTKGNGVARTLQADLKDVHHGLNWNVSNEPGLTTINHSSRNNPNGAKVDSLEQIEIPLKHDRVSNTQSNGSTKGDLVTARNSPDDKGDTKSKESKSKSIDCCTNLSRIYNDEVLVINSILSAKKVVQLLTKNYRNLVYACDTEVAKIDVKQETPVNHGEIICFSIYSGPGVDFGNGKSCIWVWHNYSFDSHVIENYGIKLSGFHADTMHMARLWDSSRRTEGGYSLEALTSNSNVMNGASKATSGKEKLKKIGTNGLTTVARVANSSSSTEGGDSLGLTSDSMVMNGAALTRDSEVTNETQSSINRVLIGKTSMKAIFGKKKLKKDGKEGKITILAPVEELQREERNLWICYSALDSMSTLQLFDSLKSKLMNMKWVLDGKEVNRSMYEFYQEYWRPFGELLVKMETEGMLVDRTYLAEIQKVATQEQQIAGNRFRNWAARYCPDAIHMNVGSDTQLRQLFFGGTPNSKNPNEFLDYERTFKVPNVDKVIEEGKKVPTKFRNIKISSLKMVGVDMKTDMCTATGWPSASGDALKTLAGKVSSEYEWIDDAHCFDSDIDDTTVTLEDVDFSSYGTAYKAFENRKGGNKFENKKEGKEACHAIAALCEVCSIDSLISNFILPLQSDHISGKNGRIHCSLNINTETGRLSARRPNLQNQPALEKDRYKIRQAFIAGSGNSLIVADYGQLELRILAHLANCKSMKDAFKAGGDFHSRTAMNMYSHIREAVEKQEVLLEWHPQPGEDKPPVPLLKDAFASERRKAKMLNFSIAYGKTPIGLARDWKVSVNEAKATVELWYQDRKEVLAWQRKRKQEANKDRCVKTLLGRTRSFPSMNGASNSHKGHIERAAINTPVQGSAADVAMCAMLQISRNARLKELGWRLLLQVHDEVILEGPTESAEVAKAIVVECMSKPFDGKNILTVDLAVDAKCAKNWYAGK